MIGRNGGLTVSFDAAADDPQDKAASDAKPPPLLDAERWTKLQQGPVRDIGRELAREEAAGAARARRSQARLALAGCIWPTGSPPRRSDR